MIKEEKTAEDSVFMRTVVKKEVYDRLKEVAQRYSTGRGNWDFGVAIEILLDHYDESKLGQVSDKVDLILAMMPKDEIKEVPKKEEKFEEFLGGFREKVREDE